MKFAFNVSKELSGGISRLAENGFFEIGENGVTVTAEKTQGNLKIAGTGNTATIYYPDKAQFFHGLSYCMERYGETFSAEISSPVKRLGIMRDCARNAITSFAGIKKLLPSMALLGYNYLELYIEDLMEIEEYPYLGFSRGRYTGEEIKSFDEYAASLGIELVPAIQTLAHLPCMFKNDAFLSICDRDDILLAEEEKTYEFLDKVFGFCENNFSSRNVNIGMDEAYAMFLGKYLDKHGYRKDKDKVFLAHLNKVLELCRKHGLSASMWSDMIFKAAFGINEHVAYGNLEGKTFDKEFVKNFPKDVTLIFWDYYHDNKDFYDAVFKKHFEISDNVKFAGGIWTWKGFAPSNAWTEKVFSAAFESGLEHGCKDFLMTAWGDNGGECSIFAALGSLAYVADKIYGGDGKNLNARMSALFGNTFDDFRNTELADKPFEYGTETGRDENAVVNVSKYALYNDPLIGVLDPHILPDTGAGFAKRAEEFKALAQKNGMFSYVFESFYRLCDALSVKATLGKELYSAYHKKDNAAMREIAEKKIPAAIEKIRAFYAAFRKQWLKENKSFGFEVTGIRIGGVLQRLEETAAVINEYLSGAIDKIDELERKRIPPYSLSKENDIICYNNFAQGMTGSII